MSSLRVVDSVSRQSSTVLIDNMKKDDRTIKSVTRDYQTGIIMDVSFHASISAAVVTTIVVALMDNTIMLISSTMWDVRRVIAYPDFYIKQCQFVPHMDVGNVLMTLTSNDDLMLTCMNSNDDLNSRMLIDMHNFTSFVLSTNGRLLVSVHHSGELHAYNLEHHLNDLIMIKSSGMNGRKMKNDATATDDERRQQKMNKEKLLEIQMKVNVNKFLKRGKLAIKSSRKCLLTTCDMLVMNAKLLKREIA